MESQQAKASARVIAASVIYGFAGIFFVYVRNMAPGNVVFYQLLFGFLFLAAYMAATGRLSGARLKGKRKALFLLGVWQAGVLLSYYTAVRYTGVSISALLLYTAPIYVVLLAPFLLKEKPNLRSLAALVLSLAGVAIVVGPENFSFGGGTGGSAYFFGILMGLFAGFFYACIIMTSRHLRDEYSGLEQLFFSTAVTLVLLLPYSLKTPAASLLENLPVLLFLGAMITALGSILYFTGLMHVKAQNAGIISLLEPVSAIFFSYLILDDPVYRSTLLGCALILSSSLLVSLKGGETGEEAGEEAREEKEEQADKVGDAAEGGDVKDGERANGFFSDREVLSAGKSEGFFKLYRIVQEETGDK